MGKLSDAKVRTSKPGRYQDGDGLSLLVKPSGAASWVLRVQLDGRRRNFGLGSRNAVSLKEARERARDYRRQYRDGLDPAVERKRALKEAVTFERYARDLHADDMDPKHPRWSNAHHAREWLSSLERYAFKMLGPIGVADITNREVIDALKPYWREKNETCRRVLSRVIEVCETASARGYGDTPLRRGVISKGLPKFPKRPDTHFAAMPYQDVPAFMMRLREADVSVGRLALQFTILTATRSGEVRGARWDEIDFGGATWTIPVGRMKARREFITPLSQQALELLKPLRDARTCELVFPGTKKQVLSDMTLLKALRTAGVPKEVAVVHGFRSSFRDWCAEQMTTRDSIVEAALAHQVKDRVEAAYRRTEFLDLRRPLMQAWADYLDNTGSADVVPINANARS